MLPYKNPVSKTASSNKYMCTDLANAHTVNDTTIEVL